MVTLRKGKGMSWIHRETENRTVQYICPNCNDYHEFREDFGERTFNENFIFCRRCGAKNGTGTPPTLTPQNEWVSVEERLPEDDAPEHKVQIAVLVLTDREAVKIKNRTYHPSRFYYGKFYPARWDWGAFNDDRITHWAPLPAPPDRRPPEGEA